MWFNITSSVSYWSLKDLMIKPKPTMCSSLSATVQKYSGATTTDKNFSFNQFSSLSFNQTVLFISAKPETLNNFLLLHLFAVKQTHQRSPSLITTIFIPPQNKAASRSPLVPSSVGELCRKSPIFWSAPSFLLRMLLWESWRPAGPQICSDSDCC